MTSATSAAKRTERTASAAKTSAGSSDVQAGRRRQATAADTTSRGAIDEQRRIGQPARRAELVHRVERGQRQMQAQVAEQADADRRGEHGGRRAQRRQPETPGRAGLVDPAARPRRRMPAPAAPRTPPRAGWPTSATPAHVAIATRTARRPALAASASIAASRPTAPSSEKMCGRSTNRSRPDVGRGGERERAGDRSRAATPAQPERRRERRQQHDGLGDHDRRKPAACVKRRRSDLEQPGRVDVRVVGVREREQVATGQPVARQDLLSGLDAKEQVGFRHRTQRQLRDESQQRNQRRHAHDDTHGRRYSYHRVSPGSAPDPDRRGAGRRLAAIGRRVHDLHARAWRRARGGQELRLAHGPGPGDRQQARRRQAVAAREAGRPSRAMAVAPRERDLQPVRPRVPRRGDERCRPGGRGHVAGLQRIRTSGQAPDAERAAVDPVPARHATPPSPR